jgi:trans-aconitate 2-methyltransferase
MSAVRDWDADAYHRLSGPQEAMAAAVLDRLLLSGAETVLDAGCGSGRVTRMLLERLPRGRVIAVDGSPEMVAKARTELSDAADIRLSDLAELRLAPVERVDSVFSNAVFHWLPDHDALFAALAAALRPGGRLSAQCGGAGNVRDLQALADAEIDAAGLRGRLEHWERPWNFQQPGPTAQRLQAAGFVDVDCWMEPHRVAPEHPRDFLEAICLGPYLARLDRADRPAFIDAVLGGLGEPPAFDYVRLNIVARRGSSDL